MDECIHIYLTSMEMQSGKYGSEYVCLFKIAIIHEIFNDTVRKNVPEACRRQILYIQTQ